MSRLVELEETGPLKLDESDLNAKKGNVAICQCGLAETFPFCDGTHRTTRSETDDVCYHYPDDEADSRREVDHVVYKEPDSDTGQ
ncbi:CDGSH iron-sulfur domain-containing protein [Halobacteria archaeon AArc-curdl1]|uniref:CDGSH iron-sulfur domain-containing protein n=1 Tax=Natronosalvus hydrolyticus TaxID=2979988 RepID=A0AAP2Z7P8_9EURY|nr:CDGSH iron-sulfur domain-containing protein [Halobacteria archaeon AArc-curdl1]